MNSNYLRKPGDIVAHYRVQRLLGTGMEGNVYLVRDLRSGDLRTLKILRGRNMNAEAEHTAAHYRKLATLPSLKRFREWGLLSGQRGVGERPWLAFDYIRGETLAKRIESRRVADPLRTLIAVCDALVPFHRRGFALGDFDADRNLLVEHKTGLIRFCDLDAGGPDEPPPTQQDDVQELLRLARRLWRSAQLPAPTEVLNVIASSPADAHLGRRLRGLMEPKARLP